MSATSSDDGWLAQMYLHNEFELCSVPCNTIMFECTELAPPSERADSRGTFASTPLQALHAFLAERPREPGSVRLRVCSVQQQPLLLYDLDPLQYTRAYSDEALSLYVGAASKAQRAKVLHKIYRELRVFDAPTDRRPIQLDSFAALARASGDGFDWDVDACMDEIQELHPIVHGVHYCAPGASLFNPRLLRLMRKRIRLRELGVIVLDQTFIDLLRTAPLQLPPLSSHWHLDDPDEGALQIHNIGLYEPTGFTSLNQTGWRRTNDLRIALLEHALTQPSAPLSPDQTARYAALLQLCNSIQVL